MEKKIYLIFLGCFLFIILLKGIVYLDNNILPYVSTEGREVIICNIKDDCDFLNQKAAKFVQEYEKTTDDTTGKFVNSFLLTNFFGDCIYDNRNTGACINKAIEYSSNDKDIINTIVFFDYHPIASILMNKDTMPSNQEIYYILFKKLNETYLLEAYIPFSQGKKKFNIERRSIISDLNQLIKK